MVWPLFSSFRPFNWKISVKSFNQRVWSSKTKSTQTFMNIVSWQKSISKAKYNSHSVASISEPKIQFVNLYVNCQLWLSFIKIVVGIFVYWKTLEMYYMLYMHQDVLATVSLSNWYSNDLVLGRDKQYQDCYWIEYRILNCPHILY